MKSTGEKTKDQALKLHYSEEKGGRRRFVRLDIATPFILNRINPHPTTIKSRVEPAVNHGMLLNISGNGILGAVDRKLEVDSFVVLSFELRGIGRIERILGKVKRTEKVARSEYLTGIQFMDPDDLYDELDNDEVDSLKKEVVSFNKKLKQLIIKHIIREKKKKE
jgi:hypothetical protein